MNLLYILGKGSKWKNGEIRYSLRSVERHLQGVKEVIIVGEKPDWIKNVTHYYTPDFRTSKAANAFFKIKAACSLAGNDQFILMNDDFYFTENIDVSQIPLYWSGSIRQLYKSVKDGAYRSVLVRTESYLKDYGYQTTNYALHYPMPVRSEIMYSLLQDNFETGYSIRCLYGNMAPPWLHRHSEKKDVKLLKSFSRKETMQKIEHNGMFSISDKWLFGHGIEILKELYPEKSNFEQ